MPNVDTHFPFDERSEARLPELRLPEKLRGLRHRATAQAIFDGWLASNPEIAERYANNPQHWNDR